MTATAARMDARQLSRLFEADLIERLPDPGDQFRPYVYRDPERLSPEQIAELERAHCHWCEQSRTMGGTGCREHKPPRPGRPRGRRKAVPAPAPAPAFARGEPAEWDGFAVTVEMVCASGNAVIRTPAGLRTIRASELGKVTP